MAKLSFAFLAALGLLALVPYNQATQDPKTVCYYESWVYWRHGDGKMETSMIDPTLCTHIVYSYFGIDASTHELKLLDPYLMNDLHDLDKFSRSKGNAKAMIAVGGASMSDQFSATAGSASYRESFVNSVVHFLSQHNFDGISIDWTGIRESDAANFIALLDKFDEKFASTSYSLAVSLPATVDTLNYYDVPNIVKYVDYINVITLDYAGSWSKTVDNASPFPKQLETMEEYHKRGAPRHKMVMAVPAFARTWVLSHSNKQEPGDDASGPGLKGPFTDVPGLLSYNELCMLIKNENNAFTIVRDSHNTAIYAVYMKGNQAEWISFEDTHTLATKAKNVTEQGYAGLSVYALANEDFRGECGAKYPLLHAINENYYKGQVTEAPISTIPPIHHTTEKVTDVPGVFKCHKEGKFRDHLYCFKYYECKKGDFGLEETVLYCDRTQAFDEESGKCVERNKVKGC